jgi:hypothetical protein
MRARSAILTSMLYVLFRNVACLNTFLQKNRVEGHCIRLMGGRAACQGDEYLDPIAVECMA